jgi:hypothetical protein
MDLARFSAIWAKIDGLRGSVYTSERRYNSVLQLVTIRLG